MANGEWLHKEIQELRDDLQENFRDLRADMRDLRDDLTARLDSHSRRIRSLEQWRYILAGALGVIGGLLSVLADRIIRVLAAGG